MKNTVYLHGLRKRSPRYVKRVNPRNFGETRSTFETLAGRREMRNNDFIHDTTRKTEIRLLKKEVKNKSWDVVFQTTNKGHATSGMVVWGLKSEAVRDAREFLGLNGSVWKVKSCKALRD